MSVRPFPPRFRKIWFLSCAPPFAARRPQKEVGMRRVLIGMAVGMAVLVGSGLVAEAQIDIDPTGPTAVYSNQTSSTYTAVVTHDYYFFLRLRVFLNGVIKHDSNTYYKTMGPTTDVAKVVNMTNWGIKAGDTLLYRGRATKAGTILYDEEDWTVVVTNPSTRLDQVVPGPLRWGPGMDRDREEWV